MSFTAPILEFGLVREYNEAYNDRFKLTTRKMDIKLRHNLGSFSNLLELSSKIDEEYERVITPYIRDAGPEDTVFITINPEDDEDFKSLHMSFRKKNFDRSEFLNRAYKVSQSNQRFLLSGSLAVTVQIVKRLTGGSRILRTLVDRNLAGKSVLCIQNDDTSCGYQAIAIGKYIADNQDYYLKPEWRSLRRGTTANTKRKNLMRKLLSSIGWSSEEPVNIDLLNQIQIRLPDYQLVVVDSKNKARLFMGPENSKKVYLLYTEAPGSEIGHFDLIVSITGFMMTKRFCERCWLKVKEGHICLDCCKLCGYRIDCQGSEKQCQDCHIVFRGEQCFTNHKISKRCSKRKACVNCEVILNGEASKKHKCFEYQCLYCFNCYSTSPHYCYIKALDAEKLKDEDKKVKIFVAFDIESMQMEENSKVIHKPNLLLALVTCDKCYNVEQATKVKDPCETCGPFLYEFRGVKCVEDFCTFIYKTLSVLASKIGAKIIIFAHNNRGYDGHFIVQDYFNRNFEAKPEIILNGTKILKFEVENIRFIDSLSFFMQPLSALPKSFGLNDEKGFFPHLFNIPQNQDYKGPLPGIEFYDFDNMKPRLQKSFLEWYNAEVASGAMFNFHQDIFRYCLSDVKILLGAVMRFRHNYMNITGLDPLTRRFTIASLGLEIFRAKILPSSQLLAKTPLEGYGGKRGSIVASIWLDYVQKCSRFKIYREYRLGNLYADGYCEETKTVYEFWGCYFHGCTQCYAAGDEERKKKQEQVMKKRLLYTRWGLNLVEIWEHDLLNSIPIPYYADRRKYYEELQRAGNACIKEAFFGGRTNNIAFLYECKPNEEILYQDFTSLYPYVLKKNKYPTGHPEIIAEDFDYTLVSYFGFIKCSILPPRKLHIATLPYRLNGKLIFPLCYTCAEKCEYSSCNHSDNERQLTNTWTSIELVQALKDGYKVLKIYEVLNYKDSSVSENLFSEYIKMWLKIKQEASGLPEWCRNEENGVEKYIDDYDKTEGIKLDKDKIVKNEGLRTIAKLFLNCLWGKFAQSSDMKKTAFIHDYAELQSYLTSDSKSVKTLIEVRPDLLLIQYKERDHASQGNTNLAVASFVTAYARLELLNLIRRIESVREGRVLYFDTDSVIYVSTAQDPKIECGDYLGELTNEIGSGKRCSKFVSLGPKNYAYQVDDLANGCSKTEIKAKGITLTASCLELLSFDKIMDMGKNYLLKKVDEVFVPQKLITSDKETHQVFTESRRKLYRAVYTKRKIVDGITRPFGYVH